MDERLKQLVVQVQQYSPETEEYQSAIRELVEQILRSRSICRPSKGQPLSQASLAILQAVRQQLQQDIDQIIPRYNLERTSVRDWTNGLCHSAFQQVLDNSRLTQLALEAQHHKLQSQQRQHALQELLNAIRLSGRLSHKGRASGAVYDDAVTRTLLWVCQNLNTYNPSKGKFIAWVNYRLDMMLREIQHEYKDPFIQSIEGKIIRRKYQLNALIKKTKKADLIDWLTLYLKKILPNQHFSLTVISLLIVLLLLSQLIVQNPVLADSPEEVWEGRIGYIAVQIDELMEEATLLGFIPSVSTSELGLSELRSLTELPDYLQQFQLVQSVQEPVNLSQWLYNLFEAGWETVEALFAPSPEFAFNVRSSPATQASTIEIPVNGVKRGKYLELQRDGEIESVVVFVGVSPSSSSQLDITVEVYPLTHQPYLPPELQVMILDDRGKSVLQAEAGSSESIEFQFSGEPGERFSVKVALGNFSITEEFLL